MSASMAPDWDWLAERERKRAKGLADGQCAGLNVLGMPCTHNGSVLYEGSWYCRKHVPRRIVTSERPDPKARYHRTCEQCGISFWGWRAASRFCSQQCYAASERTVNGFRSSRQRRFIPCSLSLVDPHVFRRRVEAARLLQVDARWVEKLNQDRRQLNLRVYEQRETMIEALTAEQDADARRYWLGGRWLPSLDAQIHDDNRMERHEKIADPLTADPLVAVEQSELRDTLLRLAGTLEPDDVLRMDGDTLEWVREKLRAEGLVPRGTTIAERERLAEPNRHSGEGIKRTKSQHGGKRTRAQQQLVTRECHVRELPQATKQKHSQIRSERRQRRAA